MTNDTDKPVGVTNNVDVTDNRQNEDKARIAELEAEVRELKAGIKTLAQRVDPPPRPPDIARLEGMPAGTLRLLDQMSVPKEILDRMQQAVPDDVVRDIAKDARRR